MCVLSERRNVWGRVIKRASRISTQTARYGVWWWIVLRGRLVRLESAKSRRVRMLVKVGRRVVQARRSSAVSAMGAGVTFGALRLVLSGKAAVTTSVKSLATMPAQREQAVVQGPPMWRRAPKMRMVALCGRKGLVLRGRSAKTTLARALAKTLVLRLRRVAQGHRSSVAKKQPAAVPNGRQAPVQVAKAVKEMLVRRLVQILVPAGQRVVQPTISRCVKLMRRAVSSGSNSPLAAAETCAAEEVV